MVESWQQLVLLLLRRRPPPPLLLLPVAGRWHRSMEARRSIPVSFSLSQALAFGRECGGTDGRTDRLKRSEVVVEVEELKASQSAAILEGAERSQNQSRFLT